MMEFRPTIGLEIHAELKTSSKMFCASKNDPGESKPNVNICPVCVAHPGTLPVINREAVRHVLRVGAAINGMLADYSEFDRKNYFYPDLPKGYQISQYEFPLVQGGSLAGVKVTRIHLEEDTASSVHSEADGLTFVDYNRAGVPLMELVTEPVITSAAEATTFARELQLLLRYLGASDANMEQGQMRVEANISVSRDTKLGQKVEIKNLNSFRTVERAVEFEINRQQSLLRQGGVVEQETRGWDDAKQATFSQRVKEGSADYRYFPDPDLPSLKLSDFEELDSKSIAKSLPELPGERRARYRSLGIKEADANLFARDQRLGALLDNAMLAYPQDSRRITIAANYIANDIAGMIRDSGVRDTEFKDKMPISAESLNEIVHMLADAEITSRTAKDLLARAISGDKTLRSLAERSGMLLSAVSHSQMAVAIDTVIEQNQPAVDQYKAGKAAAIEFLVGQCMKLLKGKGNPTMLRGEFEKRLQKRS